ncbi:hypothetical protein D915_007606 [Fasciola hepatica]|uniref:C-type lectin domain-containing protein n=1 Tax=Fasciola hepatica TaxID=6192 RepID=A0A4E0RVH6_FASHE|nr:hypothetical protein D915_007606 [Fasciola hepatica]
MLTSVRTVLGFLLLANTFPPMGGFYIKEDRDLLDYLTSEDIEIWNSDIGFSDDRVSWYGAFDACVAKQRLFAFPMAGKHFRLVMLKMTERTVWVEYFRYELGWVGHAGIQKLTVAWENPEDENATVGSCAVLKRNGMMSARNCTEYHVAACMNPNMFQARRRQLTSQVS